MWLITCAIIFLSVLFYIKWQTKKPKNYPPGPVNWFGVWSLVQMQNADPEYPHEALRKLSKKYGDIMSISLGVHPAIVFSNYEDMAYLFVKDEFSARYRFPFMDERTFDKELGMLMTSEGVWRAVRRFSEKSLRDFGFKKSEIYGELIRAEFSKFSAAFQNDVKANGGIVRFENNFAVTMVRVISLFFLGFESEKTDALLQRLIDTTEATVDAIAFDNLNLLFPFLRKIVPFLTGYHRDMAVFKAHRDIVKELIDESRKRQEDGEALTFVQTFQKKVDKHAGEVDTHFTEQQMIATIMDLFLAGSETTTHFLAFCILHLVRNPEMQERIHAEICSVAPPDAIPAYADSSKMAYLQAFTYEIYRFCNIVPIPLARRALVDYEYKGFFIPKGTCLLYNLQCVFRDPPYWGDPEVFRPERFLDDSGNLTKTERIALFGFGKRICIGDSVARQSGFVFLAGMIKKFKFEIVSGEIEPSDVPRSSFTTKPIPFRALVTPRH